MAASYFTLPAVAWFLFATAILAAAAGGSYRARGMIAALGIAAASYVYAQDQALSIKPSYDGPLAVTWSPYQKLELAEDSDAGHVRGVIFANGLPHQVMMDGEYLRRDFYQEPHDVRAQSDLGSPFRRAAILGAGSGNDVATALANGAEFVDAVDIDPVIVRIGRRHHPEKPYDDPRVRLTVDDGRAFLTRAEPGYDLILFALTDSLVKVSSMSQLRLENYLLRRRPRGGPGTCSMRAAN
ncbi:MAG: hypothetical protein M5R36_21700 [Deltaproteobacteria bacterium]|nr:hypothetical protein [Deltaproteobacteria bacterium]